uniref:Uncharacterized protein n=1 Tax=Romanomermis culicivorax TaxID=13658 RepID=A0A915KZL0_ROMCU
MHQHTINKEGCQKANYWLLLLLFPSGMAKAVTKRGFQLKWKEQMPWMEWDSKKYLVPACRNELVHQDYPTAEGLFKRMLQIDFMVKLHAVNDVLYHLNTLNELYQPQKMHPYDVKIFADSICEILDAFAATTETIRKSKSMKLLTLRLTTDDLAKKLKYYIKRRYIGNNQNYDEFVKIKEEKALNRSSDFGLEKLRLAPKKSALGANWLKGTLTQRQGKRQCIFPRPGKEKMPPKCVPKLLVLIRSKSEVFLQAGKKLGQCQTYKSCK